MKNSIFLLITFLIFQTGVMGQEKIIESKIEVSRLCEDALHFFQSTNYEMGLGYLLKSSKLDKEFQKDFLIFLDDEFKMNGEVLSVELLPLKESKTSLIEYTFVFNCKNKPIWMKALFYKQLDAFSLHNVWWGNESSSLF